MKRIQAFLIGLMMSVTCICASFPVYADNEEEPQNTENETEETVGEGQDRADEDTAETQAGIEVTAPSVILMEASTGTVIFEKDADTARPPASVTKIMTMLLIFDALADESIGLEDEVTVSDYAASMGGSQVFLEPGETQTVDTMLKCIAVASANDACVAMAEYICGNEEEFVNRMNERAAGLGMENTHFVNCNGLDAEGHETSARDIALMSRELISKYPQVQGDAKFCVSATAEKNGIELIAVVMAAENSKERFADAVKLLNYGYGRCQLYTDESEEGITSAPVENGVEDTVEVHRTGPFSYLDTNGANINGIERTVEINPGITAPVKKGDIVGAVVYTLDGNEIGRTDIVAAEDVDEASFLDYLKDAAEQLFV